MRVIHFTLSDKDEAEIVPIKEELGIGWREALVQGIKLIKESD